LPRRFAETLENVAAQIACSDPPKVAPRDLQNGKCLSAELRRDGLRPSS